MLVYGATPAGVLAALGAAGEGASVALLDARGWVGGMMSGGLAVSDIGTTTAVIGGRTRAFFDAVASHYGSSTPLYNFEPHVAESILNSWLANSTITVALSSRIASLSLAGKRVASAQLSNGSTLSARVLVDATYEGLLLPQAGVDFAWGRESTAAFGESLAGVMPVPHPAWEPDHPFVAQPQVWAGVEGRFANGSCCLPGVSASGPGPVGSADDAVQAFEFRTTMTTEQSNILRPWPRPEGYDRNTYLLTLNYIASHNISTFQYLTGYGGLLPCTPRGACTNKGDDNNHKAAQFIGLSRAFVAAAAANDWEGMESAWAAHRTAQLGLYFFLANDPAVPQSIRDSAYEIGLPLDEHVACGHFPCQLYIREALRLQGDFVFTQREVLGDIAQPDSMGRGAYSIDVMHVRLWRNESSGDLEVEGGMQAPSFLNASNVPFQVPYRAFLPKASQVTNLLVPVALSSSHVGFNAVRLEPTWMTLGESAGVAAARVAAADVDAAMLDIPSLQARLWELGQVL